MPSSSLYFAMSWRNPTPEQRDWNLDTYAAAVLDAIGVTCDIAGTDAAELGKFALYGGTGSFFKADDGKALDAALDAIAGATLSCTFALSKTPDDPSKIYAFFDHTTPVARDAKNAEIEAAVLALEAIQRALDGKPPKKVIVVPQRIVNVVA